MARHTKSTTKLSRRVRRDLYLKGTRSYSGKSDYGKRPLIPSKSGRRMSPKLSEYGKQLMEKQALRYYYGLMDKQLANVFKAAFKKSGDTGKSALRDLESTIDNVIYRAGLANSRNQARQLVTHGHFRVNGVKVDIPSYKVKEGDVIEVKENKIKKAFWTSFKLQIPNQVPEWLDKSGNFKVKVLGTPLDEDLPTDFKIEAIVEFYSRKIT